ncbi:MAG: tail fiber protein [Saprospiraceae bacterium]|nr:tail fiber protein [Saprospiraceae bacterium]
MDPFIGQVILFGGNFAPRGWSFCEGQLLAISSHSALFSILGTIYGGDGRTTFGLPDLRGRIAIQAGRGPGLTDYSLGERGGTERNTHTIANMPSHNHVVSVPTSNAAGTEPSGVLGAAAIYAEEANSSYAGVTVTHTGNQQPVNNMQPYLAVNYIIALVGVYPSRS